LGAFSEWGIHFQIISSLKILKRGHLLVVLGIRSGKLIRILGPFTPFGLLLKRNGRIHPRDDKGVKLTPERIGRIRRESLPVRKSGRQIERTSI